MWRRGSNGPLSEIVRFDGMGNRPLTAEALSKTAPAFRFYMSITPDGGFSTVSRRKEATGMDA